MKYLKYVFAFITWFIIAGILYNMGYRSPIVGIILGLVIVVLFGVGIPDKK